MKAWRREARQERALHEAKRGALAFRPSRARRARALVLVLVAGAAPAVAQPAGSDARGAAAPQTFDGEAEQGGNAGAAGDADDGGSTDGGDAGAAGSVSSDGSARRPERSESARSPFGGGAELEVVSLAVWRGVLLGHGPALEPSVWASYRGFTASVWLNAVLTRQPSRTVVSALEPELAYETRLGVLELEPRVVGYWMREERQTNFTAEAGLSLSLRLLGPLSLTNSHQFDIASRPGAYYGTFGPRLEQELDEWTLGALAVVGYASDAYNVHAFGRHTAALNVLELGADAKRELGGCWYASARAGFSTLLASSLASGVRDRTLAFVGLLGGCEL